MAILTELKKEDFDKILENYNIGEHKSHKHIWYALENTVYILTTTKGKYVFKIFESGDSDIPFQINVLNYLSKNKIPCSKPIATKNKNFIIKVNKKDTVIFNYLEGEGMEKPSNKLVIDTARVLGKMNKLLMKLDLKGGPDWGKDFQFKPTENRRAKVKDIDLLKESNILLKETKTINKSKLRKSIIHRDYGASNILVKDDKVSGVIDFDDSAKDYIAYEVATFLSSQEFSIKGVKKDKMSLFLKEYQKHIKLNEEEKKAIYYFIKYRFISGIGWVKLEERPETIKKTDKWIADNVKAFRNFTRMSLDEFLKLF